MLCDGFSFTNLPVQNVYSEATSYESRNVFKDLIFKWSLNTVLYILVDEPLNKLLKGREKDIGVIQHTLVRPMIDLIIAFFAKIY